MKLPEEVTEDYKCLSCDQSFNTFIQFLSH